jgi:hypothetical protein
MVVSTLNACRVRVRVVLLIVIASAFSVGGVYAAWNHFGRGSDPDTFGFLQFVDQNIDGWADEGKRGVPEQDRLWALAHPGAVLREGEQACAWLARRPDAHRHGQYNEYILAGRYTGDASSAPIARVDRISRNYITDGAWSYLCPGVRDDKTLPWDPD